MRLKMTETEEGHWIVENGVGNWLVRLVWVSTLQ